MKVKATATKDIRDISATMTNTKKDSFFLSQKVLADTYNQIIKMLLFTKGGQSNGLAVPGRFGRYGRYYLEGC